MAGFVVGSILPGIPHSRTEHFDLRDDKQLLSSKVDDIMDEYETQTDGECSLWPQRTAGRASIMGTMGIQAAVETFLS